MMAKQGVQLLRDTQAPIANGCDLMDSTLARAR